MNEVTDAEARVEMNTVTTGGMDSKARSSSASARTWHGRDGPISDDGEGIGGGEGSKEIEDIATKGTDNKTAPPF